MNSSHLPKAQGSHPGAMTNCRDQNQLTLILSVLKMVLKVKRLRCIACSWGKLFTVWILKGHYLLNTFARSGFAHSLWAMIFCSGCLWRNDRPYTYIPHNASFSLSLSFSLKTVVASKHIQYYITFFSHSWRCQTEALRFWKSSLSQVLRTAVPQPIHHALCANDRFMHKRHHKQCEAAGMKRSESTVNGCDLKDCKAVIRIFNQSFHNSSCSGGMKGSPHFFF